MSSVAQMEHLVGRTVTELLRSKYSYVEEFRSCEFYLRLDHSILVRLGMFRNGGGFELDGTAVESLEQVSEEDLLTESCVGETIVGVYVDSIDFIHIRLSSDRYLWIDTVEGGMAVFIEPLGSPLVSDEDMRPYWC